MLYNWGFTHVECVVVVSGLTLCVKHVECGIIRNVDLSEQLCLASSVWHVLKGELLVWVSMWSER